MRNRIVFLCAALVLAAAVSGCALAQPEKGPGDRFVGFYLVASHSYDADFYSNPNLTEYGSTDLKFGKLGTHAVPRKVLFAGEDGSFPGLEGHPLYCLELEEDYGNVTKVVSTMSQGANQVNVTDGGTETVLSGTVYVGPPAGTASGWSVYDSTLIWHALRVYQDADGRAYLDGSGNSFNSGGTLSESYTQKTSTDGKERSQTLKVTVTVAEAPRLTEAALLQYRADGSLIERQIIPLTSGSASANWLPGAAWAVVEECSTERTQHTAYDRPAAGEDPVYHTLILLDEDGIGHPTQLRLEVP